MYDKTKLLRLDFLEAVFCC